MEENLRHIYQAIGSIGIDTILQAATFIETSVKKALRDEKGCDLPTDPDDDRRFEEELEEDNVIVPTAVEGSAVMSNDEDDDGYQKSSRCDEKLIDFDGTVMNLQHSSSILRHFTPPLIPIAPSDESIEENADNRQKLLSSHEICKCESSASSSAVFYTASEGRMRKFASSMGTDLRRRVCNELDKDDNDDGNECTNEYSARLRRNVERVPSIETVRRVVDFCNE
jgi:hypothetical protein